MPIRGIRNPNSGGYKGMASEGFEQEDYTWVSSFTAAPKDSNDTNAESCLQSNPVIHSDIITELFDASLKTLKDFKDFITDIKLGNSEVWLKLSEDKRQECPKVSTSSPLVSSSSIINVLRELYSIDVAATFRVPLTNLWVAGKSLINDIDAGFVLLLRIHINHDSIPSKVTPSDPIVQSVDINTKSTSYVGAAGTTAKNQPKVTSNFHPLMADPVFDGVNISIPRKVVEKEQLGETWAKKDYDEYQRLLLL
ncbi:hypothetical protein Tco_0878769 [Tanacetum coccineum]|uniref:Uncharacterized protein n=1 Tax=Tanacetum coccineum TaxID=301880 RepID=A0ABQ5C0F3_9ASTR